MDEAERLARAAQMRDKAMAAVREENERLARQAAADRCDQCPHPKRERDEEATLPNDIRLSVYSAHCQLPGPDCTAIVQAHLLSEPPGVANRMVKHLAEVPKLAAAGVTWMGCLAPDADRLLLTWRVPQMALVAAAVGVLRAEDFRPPSSAEPGAAADRGGIGGS